MNFSRLFRSRWSALFWAGGVLWTAYDVASAAPSGTSKDAPTDVTDMPVNVADLAVLANLAAQ